MGKILLYIAVACFIGLSHSAFALTELESRAQIKAEVGYLFENEDFDALEKLAKTYQSADQRTSSGLWKLTFYYYGLNPCMHRKNRTYWQNNYKKVNRWIKAYPNSASAHIVKAIIIRQHAWTHRGDGLAYTVPEKGWQPFKDKLREAMKVIDTAKPFASKDPHWYAEKITLINELGGSDQVFEKTVDEALDRFPAYYPIYFSAVRYLTPRWHGSAEQVEAFANRAVKLTKSSEGLGMYARIYWYASDTHYEQGNLFLESRVDWSKMKLGMFDVLKQYPDQWNIQNFGYFSCIAMHLKDDKETVKTLLSMTKEPIITNGGFRHQAYYATCASEALNIPINQFEPYKNR